MELNFCKYVFYQRSFIVMLAATGIFITSFIALFVWAYLSNNWRICLFICYLCFDVDKTHGEKKRIIVIILVNITDDYTIFSTFSALNCFSNNICVNKQWQMGAQHELYSLKQRPLSINTLWWLMEWNYSNRVNLNSLSIKIHNFFFTIWWKINLIKFS